MFEGFKKYNKDLTLVIDRARRTKGETSKLLEGVLEKKSREIIKEWIDSGRIRSVTKNRYLSHIGGE